MTTHRTTPRNPLIGAAVRARRAEADDTSGWPTTQAFPRATATAGPPRRNRARLAELVLRALIVAAVAAPVGWYLLARGWQ